MSRLAWLFWDMFRISLFVVGGGYAILAVADGVFARRGVTKENELFDALPVFQMVPGIIAAHTAVYVGRKEAGMRGAAVALAGVALPSVALFSLVAAGYEALPVDHAVVQSVFVGLRAALTGIVAAAVLRSWPRNVKGAYGLALAAGCVAALLLGAPVTAVLACAVASGLVAEFAPSMTSGRRTFRCSLLPFLVFLKYGLLCFGGGFVLVPMYIEDFVGASAPFLQISEAQFSNLMALTQMTPGPIGLNGATYFGFQLGGIGGALLASALLILPGALLLAVTLGSLERFRTSRVVRGVMRGIRPASTSLMLVALVALAKSSLRSPNGLVWGLSPVSAVISIITGILTMKKKASVIILILVSALAAGLLHADDVTTARYPDADSVIVDEIERVKYNPDGTSESVCECWTKILTEKGRREASTERLSYSKRYGEGEIVSVGAIGSDGKERSIDVSATTKESTDNGSMGANIYDPLDRVITCTIPGLKIGETLHVKTRRKTLRPRCVGKWSDLSVMEWTSPIVRSTYEVTAPAALPLKRIAVRHPLGNLVQSKRVLPDGSTVHTFVATNSPQAFAEPDMPPMYTQVQNVRVSTAEDWPELSRWYWELCRPHLERTNVAMTNKVQEIVAAAGLEATARIRALYKFVSQEIRYMGLTMEDTSPGYAPHDVDITFDNRYGVCRDKAALLVAMLRIAGYEAFPVLIHVGAKLDAEVPQPFFNHAIVAVDRGARQYELMDPTNESTKDIFPAYLCNATYLVSRPEGDELRLSPVAPSTRHALEVKSRGKLAKDGSLVLESELAFGGINDTIYRGALLRRKPEDRVKLFEKLVRKLVPGAEMIRCDVLPKDMRDTDSPLKVSLVAHLPEMLLRGTTQDELTLPYLTRGSGMANFLLAGNTSLVKRRFPLVLDTTARVDETLTLDLGGAVGPIKTLPIADELKGGLAFSLGYCVTNGQLKAERHLAVDAVEFAPDAYAALREQVKTVEAADRRRPVFSVDPLAEADVHVLLDKSETDVTSATSWVTRRTIVKEILTYDGKKKSAELKFSYNPTWQDVKVVSAVVSNLDGRVVKAGAKEMNVMDCNWASAAPRYPASKLLVVNLPSVEIGSVVSFTAVTSVTNAPASLYATASFDSVDPIDRRIVRVNGWKREAIRPKRIPNEPGQPDAALWRDVEVFTSNSFSRAAARLRKADPGKADPSGLVALAGKAEIDDVKAIRDWTAKYIRVVGPSLYDLPIEAQLTPPATVLKERYATRLDYIRTLCALLRGAGFDADIVYAANNANDTEAVRRRDRVEKPNVRAYSNALCRVRLNGGAATYYLGTENEYAPLGATAWNGSDWFDPTTEAFGRVSVPNAELADAEEETDELFVRENGSVDFTVTSRYWGSAVGTFRKSYAEILPEERSRRYQAILGVVSQAASATSELETDLAGYPAKRTFSCFVPDYATVSDDTLTLQLPAFESPVPTFVGGVRQTPFAVGAEDQCRECVIVRFPEGYTRVEALPQGFSFGDPQHPEDNWVKQTVTSEVKDGVLEVRIVRMRPRRPSHWYGPEMIELIKDWNRIAGSKANRTIVVRKAAP